MELSLSTWIVVPLTGGLIGYITNRIAVKMIFRPIAPVNVMGLKIQGLIGRRQKDLSRSIGNVVGKHLVGHDDIMAALDGIDLERVIGGAVRQGLSKKVEQLKSMPLVGSFLTDDRIEELQASVVRGILAKKEMIFNEIEGAVEDGLDIKKIVTEKVEAFPVERLEELVLEVASRELRAIEIWGAVLGVLIGFLQVLFIGMQ